MKFTNNKLTKLIILSVALSVLISGFYYIFAPGKIVQTSASHVMYNDPDELTADADLIVIGQPEKDFSEYTPSITYSNVGRYEDYYTITDVKVLKVIKGDNSLTTIPVAQHAALINNTPFKLQKDLLTTEDYSVMQKNNMYLLFLKKVDDGTYGIISINQGKFNIDNLDKEEMAIVNCNNQYKELKQAVIAKYSEMLPVGDGTLAATEIQSAVIAVNSLSTADWNLKIREIEYEENNAIVSMILESKSNVAIPQGVLYFTGVSGKRYSAHTEPSLGKVVNIRNYKGGGGVMNFSLKVGINKNDNIIKANYIVEGKEYDIPINLGNLR